MIHAEEGIERITMHSIFYILCIISFSSLSTTTTLYSHPILYSILLINRDLDRPLDVSPSRGARDTVTCTQSLSWPELFFFNNSTRTQHNNHSIRFFLFQSLSQWTGMSLSSHCIPCLVFISYCFIACCLLLVTC